MLHRARLAFGDAITADDQCRSRATIIAAIRCSAGATAASIGRIVVDDTNKVRAVGAEAADPDQVVGRAIVKLSIGTARRTEVGTVGINDISVGVDRRG